MGNICSACERDREYFQMKGSSIKHPRAIPITTLIEKERKQYTTETAERRNSSCSNSSKHIEGLTESITEERANPVNKSMTQAEFMKRTMKNAKNFNTSLRPSTSYLIRGEVAMRALNGEPSLSQETNHYDADRGKLKKAAIKIQRWFLKKKGFRNRGIEHIFMRQLSTETRQTEDSICLSFPMSCS